MVDQLSTVRTVQMQRFEAPGFQVSSGGKDQLVSAKVAVHPQRLQYSLFQERAACFSAVNMA
jgi:hypothetical protein